MPSSVLKFAYDTKVFRVVDSCADGQGLQADLTCIEKWADQWEMQFNSGKCKVVHYGSGSICFGYTGWANKGGTFHYFTSLNTNIQRINVIVGTYKRNACATQQQGRLSPLVP